MPNNTKNGIIASHLAFFTADIILVKLKLCFDTDWTLPCQTAQLPIMPTRINPGRIPAKKTDLIEIPAVTP